MAKDTQKKKPKGWVIAVGVIISLAIIQEYPWILILAAVACIAVVGVKHWKKRKSAQVPLPSTESARPVELDASKPAADATEIKAPVGIASEGNRESLNSAPVPAAAEDPSPAEDEQRPTTKITEYTLKGVFKCEKAIFHDLMEENYAYEYTKQEMIDAYMTDSPVYKWVPDMLPARLAPEPDNPYDKNAIRVFAGETMIGYIPKGKCPEVQKIIDEDRILSVAYEITGGKYKLVSEDYDPSTDKSKYTMESGYEEVAAKVYIKEQL